MIKEDIKKQFTERLQALQQPATQTKGQSTPPQPSEAPSERQDRKLAFYELDRYAGYRDLFMLVGLVLVLYGVSYYSIPIMIIIAGLMVLIISWMMAR